MASASILELIDPAGAAPDPLGVWQTTAADAPSELAFSAGDAGPAPDAPVWRVSLPADPRQARAQLAAARDSLGQSRHALAAADRRLRDFVAGQGGPGGELHFAALAAAPAAERELMAMIGELKGDPGVVHYGIGETIGGGWEEARRQFEAFRDQVMRSVVSYAWVETRVAEQLLGRTTVGWTGAMRTVWLQGIAADQMLLHHNSLALALESRQTLLRTFAFVSRGAAILAVAVATPGGFVTAAPAAWKFFSDVIKEIKSP